MRKSYTMTAEEFAALGATPPPEGYVPDVRRPVGGSRMVWGQFHAIRGVVPLVQPDCLATWQDIAEHHKVRLMSIRWPDPYYPDFTAEPL